MHVSILCTVCMHVHVYMKDGMSVLVLAHTCMFTYIHMTQHLLVAAEDFLPVIYLIGHCAGVYCASFYRYSNSADT